MTSISVGYIPMRQLVYRVQALPRSILPLVWDFGQLTIDVEKLYIAQMVRRCVRINYFLYTANSDKVSVRIVLCLAAYKISSN